jgi:hypothetical protein
VQRIEHRFNSDISPYTSIFDTDQVQHTFLIVKGTFKAARDAPPSICRGVDVTTSISGRRHHYHGDFACLA